MWRHLQGRGRHGSFLGIGDRGKYSLVDLLVALDGLVLLGLPEFLQFIEITMDGVGQAGEVVRQEIRVSEPHQCCACSLRYRTSVAEIGIGKMGVPIKVV